MAWTRESKTNPIIDTTLGLVTTWNGTEFNWDALTTAYFGGVPWTREVKSVAGWTKEA
jgi:hypothetical protein